MDTNDRQSQPHYAPSSVGALMDPAFLRRAMIEVNDDRHAGAMRRPLLLSSLHGAVRAVRAALRRWTIAAGAVK